MHFQSNTLVIAGLLSSYVSASALSVAAEKRAVPVCNADNVLRALRDVRYSSSASFFCSGFIKPTSTTTVKATLTKPTTVATVTPLTTVLVTVQFTETQTITSSKTVPAALQNRGIVASPLPTYLAQYPANSVSSACSCFITPSLLGGSTVTETLFSTVQNAATATGKASTIFSTRTSVATATATAITTITTSEPEPEHCTGAVGSGENRYLLHQYPEMANGNYCRDTCWATLRCQSFSVARQVFDFSDLTICMLYSESVNIVLDQSSYGPSRLYDFTCARGDWYKGVVNNVEQYYY